MSSRLVLFGGAALAAVVGLKLILTPKAFRLVVIGLSGGITVGGGITYMNRLRHHALEATYAPPVGISGPPINYAHMRAVIYKHLKDDYEERGELDLGEEHITVQPGVFAQIGVLDVDGVRQMWCNAVLPVLKRLHASSTLQNSAGSARDLEGHVVFCDIGSGVGNVCLQVLAETQCRKVVGIDVIPSRIRASEEAMRRAHEFYPEVFEGKEARWFEENLCDSTETLRREKVNVIFTHSWMFDKELMDTLTSVIADVPTIECVVTSRKLDEKMLKTCNLRLESLTHFSADWNDEAPFYVYGKYN